MKEKWLSTSNKQYRALITSKQCANASIGSRSNNIVYSWNKSWNSNGTRIHLICTFSHTLNENINKCIELLSSILYIVFLIKWHKIREGVWHTIWLQKNHIMDFVSTKSVSKLNNYNVNEESFKKHLHKIWFQLI